MCPFSAKRQGQMGQVGHIKSEYGHYICARVRRYTYCLLIVIYEVSDARSHYSVQFSREFIRTEPLYDATVPLYDHEVVL